MESRKRLDGASYKEFGCVARLDRVQLLADTDGDGKPPVIPGYDGKNDRFVRQQTLIKTYRRVRYLLNPVSATQVFWQWQPQASWLDKWKLTLVANDWTGLRPADMQPVVKALPTYRISLLEIAWDFPSAPAGVDAGFVFRHGKFGKSRPNQKVGGPGEACYGSRKSYAGKFVRCYEKAQLASFRVELQLHGGWLKAHSIEWVEDLPRLAKLLVPKEVGFFKLDWNRLRRQQDAPWCRRLRLQARREEVSLHGALARLRRCGVRDAHRYLRPMKINRDIVQAVRGWCAQW